MNPGSSFDCWKILLILLCLFLFGSSIAGYFGYRWLEAQPIKDGLINLHWSTDEEGETVFRQSYKTELNGQYIKVEIADETDEIQQGLSDRLSMGDEDGMLFLLERGNHSFWMNRMHFALDIIWIDQGMIVDIQTLQPPSETGGIPVTYIPGVEADMVLELTAGGAGRYGLQIGDAVEIQGLE